jgi:hypothetical protein
MNNNKQPNTVHMTKDGVPFTVHINPDHINPELIEQSPTAEVRLGGVATKQTTITGTIGHQTSRAEYKEWYRQTQAEKAEDAKNS